MQTDKLTGLLGLARRAGKLSLGHDAVLDSMKAGSAELCLLSSDASGRLYKELVRASENLTQAHVPIYVTDYTMDGFGRALGAKKTAVLSVNDRGFAKRITEELTV